jgi:hypothetical protein
VGLLENFASSVTGPAPVTPPRPPRAMTAAGQRVDLRNPSAITHHRTEWQDQAWNYRDSVPELQFVASFIRSSLGRLRVFPAERRPRGVAPQPLEHEPVVLDKVAQQVKVESKIGPACRTAALAATRRINLDQFGSTLLARLGENLEFAGEAYLLGEEGDEGEVWSIRSVSEISRGPHGVRLIEPGQTSGGRELVEGRHELLRLWNPHPRHHDWPDSPIAALLKTCRAMLTLSDRGYAHDLSRISNGTILYLPDELSLSRAGTAPGEAEVDGALEDDDPFFDELTAFMTVPIANPSDPSAVVPLIMRGPTTTADGTSLMKDAIGTVNLHNDDPKDLDTRRDNLVAILARGIDLPPEVLTGIGDTNHWNGAVVSAETVKSHIEPRAERMCDALTVAYLWPALKAMGIPRAEREKVCLWFDPSELMQTPDRAQAAKDAHEAGAISDATLRRSLGFTEEDTPDDREKLVRTLAYGRAYEASIPILISLSNLDRTDPDIANAMKFALASIYAKNGAQPGERSDTTGRADGRPTETNKAGDRARSITTPNSGARAPSNAPAVRASAVESERLVEHRRASSRLARIDHELTIKLLAHAEATVGRAVEKAANRLRGQAQKNPLTAATFPKGVDPREVLRRGGRALTAALDDEAALEGALDDYATQFDRDTAAAARAVEQTLGEMVGKDRARGVADRLIARGRSAWQWLKGRLRDRIREVLYGERPLPTSEADSDFVPASLIRGAIMQMGGLPEGSAGVADDGRPVRGPGDPVRPATGPGTGIEVMDVMRGADAEVAKWRWVYPASPRQHFEPHQRLDGVEFDSWTDPVLDAGADASWIGPSYHPSDHQGCLCSSEIIWATPVKPTPELQEVG